MDRGREARGRLHLGRPSPAAQTLSLRAPWRTTIAWYVLYTCLQHERVGADRLFHRGIDASLAWIAGGRQARRPLVPRPVFVRYARDRGMHLTLIGLAGVQQILGRSQPGYKDLNEKAPRRGAQPTRPAPEVCRREYARNTPWSCGGQRATLPP